MPQFAFRRALVIPLALLVANFTGFAYAHWARAAQAARNPHLTRVTTEPLPEAYGMYLAKVVHLDLGQLPNQVAVADALVTAGTASLGLLAVAMILSIVTGLVLGLAATRVSPPGVAGWLNMVSTIGLAMPGFYLGSLLVLGSVYYVLWGPGMAPPIPVQGY